MILFIIMYGVTKMSESVYYIFYHFNYGTWSFYIKLLVITILYIVITNNFMQLLYDL